MILRIFSTSGIAYTGEEEITDKELKKFKEDVFKSGFVEVNGLFIRSDLIECFELVNVSFLSRC